MEQNMNINENNMDINEKNEIETDVSKEDLQNEKFRVTIDNDENEIQADELANEIVLSETKLPVDTEDGTDDGRSKEIDQEYYLESLLDPNKKTKVEREYKFEQLMMMYRCAIREVSTKLEVLNDDLGSKYDRNPIEHINSRIKEPVSIAMKLKKMGLPLHSESIPGNLNDVAGIRVICSFIDDIYTIAGMLIRQDDIKLIKMKDYINNPKPNGYRSLHLIVEIPVFFADATRPMRVEVQIRTIAMDFWASLDHHLRYKKDLKDAESIEKELKRCADVISNVDEDMLRVRKRIFEDDKLIETKNYWK